ncbi:MAG: rhodanese-like domain-containing protein [Clostridia bacterium]|nr:rhodanese-like domain-containing protein [Clostridia bacterium]MBQ8973656.1 rhodanese-like domain-containing protein [Clostridia bacterium]
MSQEMTAKVAEIRKQAGALLVDVRTPDEYAAGHIPGSVNVPLENIFAVDQAGATEETPLYLYCLTGTRANRAKLKLEREGYQFVENIGGIEQWDAEVEKNA